MDKEKIEQLQKWVDASDRIVFFGGAGVSTESGIPDFRSQDGLYHQQYDVPPETILSHTYFERHTGYFYTIIIRILSRLKSGLKMRSMDIPKA